MSDTPETDALLDDQLHDCVPFDDAAAQLAELCRKLERERDEARAGEIVEELDNERLRGQVAEWRECAEKFARLLRQRIDHDDDVFLDWEADALAKFDRLKEASK